MSVDKSIRIVKRNGKYMPAKVSLHSGRVLKLYRSMSENNYSDVKPYIRGMRKERNK